MTVKASVIRWWGEAPDFSRWKPVHKDEIDARVLEDVVRGVVSGAGMRDGS